MTSKFSSALPSHLKPSGPGNGDANGGFTRQHHGKSQSHVVSVGISSGIVAGVQSFWRVREDI